MKSSEKKFLVSIIDDHTLFAEGFKALLKKFKFVKVLGTFTRCKDFLDDKEKNPPYLVFVDIYMNGMSGFELVKILKLENPLMKIIIVSFSDDGQTVHDALELGVDGYITKDIKPENLKEVFESIRKDKVYLTPVAALNHANYLIEASKNNSKRGVNNPCRKDFSEREIGIIILLDSGKKEREMADLLNVSIKTIQKDKKRIVNKLGIKSQSQIIPTAYKYKILT